MDLFQASNGPAANHLAGGIKTLMQPKLTSTHSSCPYSAPQQEKCSAAATINLHGIKTRQKRCLANLTPAQARHALSTHSKPDEPVDKEE